MAILPNLSRNVSISLMWLKSITLGRQKVQKYTMTFYLNLQQLMSLSSIKRKLGSTIFQKVWKNY